MKTQKFQIGLIMTKRWTFFSHKPSKSRVRDRNEQTTDKPTVSD